jgi:murein DD-endopeptidase MepM/ murein hydrolase activator NlpD
MKTFKLKRSVGFALILLSLSACQTTGSKQRPIYTVKVQTGDTLASLAARYDTRWEEIARTNGLRAGEALKIGRLLRIKPGPGGVVAADDAPVIEGPRFQEQDYPDVSRSPDVKKQRGGLFFGKGEDSASLQWPIYGGLSSHYGRRHGRFHHGIDIRAKKGTMVLSSAPGIVEFAGRQNGYGKVVIVKHEQIKTLYAHLKSISVEVGQKVDKSTELGETGASGHVSGPHLHFEVRTAANQSMNPLDYLEKNQLLLTSTENR